MTQELRIHHPLFTRRRNRDHVSTEFSWPKMEVTGGLLLIRNYYLFSDWWLLVSVIFEHRGSRQHRVRMTEWTYRSARRWFKINYKAWTLFAKWKAERASSEKGRLWERLSPCSPVSPPRSPPSAGGRGRCCAPLGIRFSATHPSPSSCDMWQVGMYISAQLGRLLHQKMLQGQVEWGWKQDRKPQTLIWHLKNSMKRTSGIKYI